MTCCQLADDELVAQEAEAFDCETCPLAAQLAALDDDNQEAWALYRACCNRFLVDTHAVGVALARLTAEDDPETFAQKAERLRILYDTLQPVKRTT